MKNPLLTLLLCISNPFSWNLFIYKMVFHKLSGCKLVLCIALAMSHSLLGVGNVQDGSTLTYLVCPITPGPFHAADCLRVSKADGCKENSSL